METNNKYWFFLNLLATFLFIFHYYCWFCLAYRHTYIYSHTNESTPIEEWGVSNWQSISGRLPLRKFTSRGHSLKSKNRPGLTSPVPGSCFGGLSIILSRSMSGTRQVNISIHIYGDICVVFVGPCLERDFSNAWGNPTYSDIPYSFMFPEGIWTHR